MNYRNTELIDLSRELMMKIHRLTVQLSSIQMFDAHLYKKPEGAGTLDDVTKEKKYCHEFYKFLVCSQASDKYDINRIEHLLENGLLTKENVYEALKIKSEGLLRIIKGFKGSEGEDASLSI